MMVSNLILQRLLSNLLLEFPSKEDLLLGGFKDRPTVIEFSRVDNPDIFLEEEAITEEVTRAAFIDISNLIGTADEITGLGAFEANRLAVFTKKTKHSFTLLIPTLKNGN